jgi:hypothetical protein
LGIFQDRPLPWVVSLLDLCAICELIEIPSQFVHFLRRRLRLNELKLVDATDELDWLGCYFHNGLYFENLKDMADEPPDRIFLQTSTTEIDEWYMFQSGFRRTPVEKPRQAIPERLREVIAELERDHQLGYTTAVCLLLDFDGDARARFASMLEDVRGWSQHDSLSHDFTIVSFGGRSGVTCFTTVAAEAERWAKRLLDYCTLYKYRCRADNWLGLLSIVDQPGSVHLYLTLDAPWKPTPAMDRLIEELRTDGRFLNLTSVRPARSDASKTGQ